MTDEPALIAAVCDRPDDDTPRGVYADWCDDNAGTVACDWCRGTGEDRRPEPFTADGKRYEYVGPVGPCPKCKGAGSLPDGLAARAAFIRAQVKLARLPNFRENPRLMEQATAGDPELMTALGEYTAATKEAAEAFAAMPIGQKILTGGEGADGWSCEFFSLNAWGRGFPAAIRACGSEFWRRFHAAILAAAPIRRVELRDTPEVDFGPAIETTIAHPEDRRTDTRTAWEATWGDHRETFGLLTTVTHEMTYRGGAEVVQYRLEQHRAEVEAARTPLGYLRLRWPGVEFVLSSSWRTAAANPFADLQHFRAMLERDMIRGLGIPPALIDHPRYFIIRPPTV